MLKTYLYVPEQLDREVEKVAKLNNTSKAQVLREVIQEGLNVIRKQRSGGAEVLLKIAELGKKYNLKGPKDSSVRMNELLWGRDWSKNAK